MNARPDTNPTDQAEAEKPVMERPIGRRTMLRAAILTVPVVAAFSQNAWAFTARSCPAGSTFCATCSGGAKCIKNSGNCNGNCNPSKCGDPNCIVAPNANVVRNQQSAELVSPFNANNSAINDGGFNASPWK